MEGDDGSGVPLDELTSFDGHIHYIINFGLCIDEDNDFGRNPFLLQFGFYFDERMFCRALF